MEAQAQRKAILLEARIRGMENTSVGFGIGFAETGMHGEHSLAAPITEFGFRGESSRDSQHSRDATSSHHTVARPQAPRLAPGAPAPRDPPAEPPARRASSSSSTTTPREKRNNSNNDININNNMGPPTSPTPTTKHFDAAEGSSSPPGAAAASSSTAAGASSAASSSKGAAKRKSTAPQRHAGGKKPLTEAAAEANALARRSSAVASNNNAAGSTQRASVPPGGWHEKTPNADALFLADQHQAVANGGGGGGGGGESPSGVGAFLVKEEELVAALREAREARAASEDMFAALQQDAERSRRAHTADVARLGEQQRRLRGALETTLRSVAMDEAREERKALARAEFELGRQVFALGRDAWEDGDAEKDIKQRAVALLARRDHLDRAKRDRLKRRKRKDDATKKSTNNTTTTNHHYRASSEATCASQPSSVAWTSPPEEDVETLIEALADDESHKAQVLQLKRDEANLAAERALVERRKMRHVRESQRAKAEDASRWRHRPRMNERYVLLRLLGRGGFSEVWLAFDLDTATKVAVKFHTIEPTWPDAKKEAYIRHTAREFDIQKHIDHPRVVRCLDVFEVDPNTMAMVLEYCAGDDLDARLRSQKTLAEPEARAVLLQVLAGLRCLHTPGGTRAAGGSSSSGATPAEEPRKAIIHYDLKPGNILFDTRGDAKITDFGLSKIVSETLGNTTNSLELTSQGAGTYWYLPPECFVVTPGTPPRISGKVDVWSLGVVFYQMLYGTRPFGEGQSQQQLLNNSIMLRAHTVDFPAKPPVSDLAKDFLRATLSHSQTDRPDIIQCCQHEYIQRGPSTNTNTNNYNYNTSSAATR